MRARLSVVGVSVAAFGLLMFALSVRAGEVAGCDKVAAQMAAPAGCYDDGDCVAGSVCRNGRCVPVFAKKPAAAPAGCYDDGDCVAGSVCRNGKCVPVFAKSAAAAPAGCYDDGDCVAGSVCRNGRCVPVF